MSNSRQIGQKLILIEHNLRQLKKHHLSTQIFTFCTNQSPNSGVNPHSLQLEGVYYNVYLFCWEVVLVFAEVCLSLLMMVVNVGRL